MEKISASENIKSIDEHERELNDRLFSMQLQYAQRIWEKKIPPPPTDVEKFPDTFSSFEKILHAYTDIDSRIYDAFVNRARKHPDWITPEGHADFDRFKDGVLARIREEYERNPGGWMQSIPRIIDTGSIDVPLGPIATKLKYKAGSWYRDLRRRKEGTAGRIGMMRYNLNSGFDMDSVGISEADTCMYVHFDPLFQHREKTESVFASKNFVALAALISNRPEVKAILADSWLVDTPLAKRAGFHISRRSDSMAFLGSPFWYQFITAQGEIHDERVKQFLETGVSPFKMARGYMLRDEFLKKYLKPQTPKAAPEPPSYL